MSVTVGTNSYVTVVEADAYITSTFFSGDEQVSAWNLLTDADKEIALIRSVKEMEQLPFIGYKTETTQLLGFPRNGETVVPECVKEAQIVNALAIVSAIGDSHGSVLGDPIARGVKSYSIDDFSETFFAGTVSITNLSSTLAKQLLYQWLNGGYEVR